MEMEDIEACWNAVKDLAWEGEEILGGVRGTEGLQQTFREHGGLMYSSNRSLWPPTHFCINTECPYFKDHKARKLQRTVQHNVILYTLDMGPIPVKSHQMTCEGCSVVYHLDYFVKIEPSTNERLRHYYNFNKLPAVLQVATHHFVETRLARTWCNSMLYGWTSASNCVKILLLFEYHLSCGSHLCVPQVIDQAQRFDDEMECVNTHIRVHGQPEIDHKCEKCVRTVCADGVHEVFAVVCDGVTVGHPCCGIPHCEGKLWSTKDTFCFEHADKSLLCRVSGCHRPLGSKASKACDLYEHQAAEKQFREKERAAFQLKQRYERQRQADGEANALWNAGEDLNTEGFARVARFAKNTFEHRRKPNHFIFDCNCILSKHVWHPNTDPAVREFFKDIGLAVDIFHFKSKHKEVDLHCSSYCNPYKFPELMYTDENGEE
ncbi:hypothetical protein K435DRAFT_848526 [Dendrothele bispora CBS 962.96]|uniref:CxC6 like cysteine cluster associated with KDZ domain-containing protein n=1 Tax=Dendrothele bispora (strain CBS 962.96) TaxID=1314807 RepID=A0A4S8MV83_DENBC|nr:hypothetical protein K435DRAFT_848526 [Dendrothele bispora CBS 962.96]